MKFWKAMVAGAMTLSLTGVAAAQDLLMPDTGAFDRAIGLQAQGRIPVGLIYRSVPAINARDLPNPSTSDLLPATHLADYRELLHRYQV